MHHIHRQIMAVENDRSFIVAQKVENRESFPIENLHVVPRSPFRFVARGLERYGHGAPWQISRGEASRIDAHLREHGAQVLHVFFGNVAVHLLPLLERTSIPIVVSFHGADVTGAIAGDAYRAARQRVFSKAAAVACRSAALMDEVAGLGCDREKLVLVPTVLPEIQPVDRTLPDDGSFRLVQASRLIPKKGIATTIAAFARLSAEFPRMTLVIAGTGPGERELREQADRLGVAAKVQFAGFIDQAALRDLFSSSHVFVHPSEVVFGDVEGVPNSMLEAMASGLPVVATRHGGIPEVVEDGTSGLLVDERDADGLAKAVRSLVTNAVRYSEISAGGITAVNERFSADIVGQRLNALYSQVAGS